MTFNLFGPPTKDDIRVGYIDPNRGLVEGVTICQANDYALKNPGTTFIFKNGNQTIQYLNINDINQIDPTILISTDECGGINQKKECGPPNIQLFGGGGIGAAGNPVIGRDGALLAVDIVRGGNGYQFPPLVAARDNCNYGSGATLTAVLGEVTETIESYENESDFEDYELCEPTDVGYGRRYGPDGEDLGPWEPSTYTEPNEDPIRNEVIKFQEIVRKLARSPFWTTRKNKPTRITCSDARVIPSKYDVTFPVWNEFMNKYAISPVSPSNVRGSDFAGRVFTFEWTEEFPTDGDYIFRGLCDNTAQLFVDEEQILNLGKFNGPVRPIKRTFKKGIYTIRVDLLNIPINDVPQGQSETQAKIFDVDFTVKSVASSTFASTFNISELGINVSKPSRTAVNQTISKKVEVGKVYNVEIEIPQSKGITLQIRGNTLEVEDLKSDSARDLFVTISNGKFFDVQNGARKATCKFIIEGSGNVEIAESVVSSRSWNDNPMGVSVTIDAPEPPIPQEPAPIQEGRCPPNPIWTTRFPGAKEFWYPVQFNGSKSPQGKKEPWAKFFNRYAISPIRPLDTPGSDGGGVVFTNSWDLEIPYDGFYKFAVQRDNTARLYVDGNLAFDTTTSGDDKWRDFRDKPKFQKVFIAKGRHTIGVELENTKSEFFEQVSQKIFRTKDWQSGSISASGVTYEGPPLFAYKDNRWGEFMNNHSVSPVIPGNLASERMRSTWKGVRFPESGQYDIRFLSDSGGILFIGGKEVLRAQQFAENPQTFKVNVTQGTYDVVVDNDYPYASQGPNTIEYFRDINPTGFALVIRKNVSVLRDHGKSWDENPMGVGAILIPPPCPRRIRGRGVVTDVIVNDPGNGYLRPIPQEQGYPVALRLKEVIVENPGINYNCGVDELIITPSNGAELDYVCDPFGKISEVKVLNPGLGFTEYPDIRMVTPEGIPGVVPTGVNASFRPVFEVVRDPIVLPERLIQVTDLVGLKQTGYVDGRPYYGSVYYDQGVRYAGFYETVGEPIQVYNTLQESITAQVTTPASAIQRQGTDISSNDPRLNIPGTPQNLI